MNYELNAVFPDTLWAIVSPRAFRIFLQVMIPITVFIEGLVPFCLMFELPYSLSLAGVWSLFLGILAFDFSSSMNASLFLWCPHLGLPALAFMTTSPTAQCAATGLVFVAHLCCNCGYLWKWRSFPGCQGTVNHGIWLLWTAFILWQFTFAALGDTGPILLELRKLLEVSCHELFCLSRLGAR